MAFDISSRFPNPSLHGGDQLGEFSDGVDNSAAGAMEAGMFASGDKA